MSGAEVRGIVRPTKGARQDVVDGGSEEIGDTLGGVALFPA